MRLALYSDLHLEHQAGQTLQLAPLDVDVVVLAGDIGSHTHGLTWASETFGTWPSAPDVVYVVGNHEYYWAHLGLLAQMRSLGQGEANISVLERDVLTFPAIRILGCTLWSGFDLYGPDDTSHAMLCAKRGINDYLIIRAREGALQPKDTLALHQQSVHWLDTELSKAFAGHTVVVTHFAPHRGCIAPQHEGTELAPYFVTDLSWLMRKHQVKVWCHGHTHTNVDFVAEGGCRVVSNQLGYLKEGVLGAEFRPELVVEL